MLKILEKGLGANVRFSTYGNINDTNTFEGQIVNILMGKTHDMPATALARHANIYPSLPQSVKDTTPNDFRQYNFVVILKADGAEVTIGVPWINDATVESIVDRKCSIVLTNFKDADAEQLRKQLVQNGHEIESIVISG